MRRRRDAAEGSGLVQLRCIRLLFDFDWLEPVRRQYGAGPVPLTPEQSAIANVAFTDQVRRVVVMAYAGISDL